MKQIITAKLKLITTPEHYQILRQTQLAYRDALNYVSQYAFEHGKMSNAQQLHKATYTDVRMQFKLLSQTTCSVMRQVGATYKALWTKAKNNAEHRRAGYTKKRFKGLDNPPKYVSPTIAYVYGHDYVFKSDQHVRIGTLKRRIIIPYQGYEPHISLIRQGINIGGAKLWYDKPRKQFYLLVSIELDVVDPVPEVQHNVVGVDVGQRYLATVATLDKKSQFFSGRVVRAKADHYARLHKRLQRKGTRSAKRRLIAISGRERRLKLNVNHFIAKQIIENYPHSLIGLETLTGIRERKPRRRRRVKDGKVLPSTPKQRRANRHASKWAFAELQNIIAYKATLAESTAIKVDADYTSQTCPMCGYTSKRNRPKHGLLFVCQNEHCVYTQQTNNFYTLHADLVGARNVAMRTFTVW